jgi:hypothetical protein
MGKPDFGYQFHCAVGIRFALFLSSLQQNNGSGAFDIWLFILPVSYASYLE